MSFFSCKQSDGIIVRSMINGHKIINHSVFVHNIDSYKLPERVVGFWERLSTFLLIGDIKSDVEEILTGDYYYSTFVGYDGYKSVRFFTIYCDSSIDEKLKCIAAIGGYELK